MDNLLERIDHRLATETDEDEPLFESGDVRLLVAEVCRLEAVSAGQRAIIDELLADDAEAVLSYRRGIGYICELCHEEDRKHSADCVVTRARAVGAGAETDGGRADAGGGHAGEAG